METRAMSSTSSLSIGRRSFIASSALAAAAPSNLLAQPTPTSTVTPLSLAAYTAELLATRCPEADLIDDVLCRIESLIETAYEAAGVTTIDLSAIGENPAFVPAVFFVAALRCRLLIGREWEALREAVDGGKARRAAGEEPSQEYRRYTPGGDRVGWQHSDEVIDSFIRILERDDFHGDALASIRALRHEFYELFKDEDDHETYLQDGGFAGDCLFDRFAGSIFGSQDMEAAIERLVSLNHELSMPVWEALHHRFDTVAAEGGAA